MLHYSEHLQAKVAGGVERRLGSKERRAQQAQHTQAVVGLDDNDAASVGQVLGGLGWVEVNDHAVGSTYAAFVL